MKSMQKFAAQQLSKEQMSTVKGSGMYNCSVSIDGAPGVSGRVRANSSMHAAAELALVYKDMGRVEIACS